MPLSLDDVVELRRHFRFQWEQAQHSYVLLYPEGMVKLSESAGEIMKRVNGATSIDGIVKDLEKVFPGADVRQDVLDFLEEAYGRGWIDAKQATR